MHQEAFDGIHDRFLKDPEFRASQPEHERDEEVFIKMNDLADKDFSHYMNIVCRLDRDGTLDEAPQNKKQKVVTGLLRDKLNGAGFCWTYFFTGL